MKKIVIAAAAALFACAVQANSEKPAAPQNQAAPKQMTAEECRTAMEQCGKDEACKEKLKTENGCK